LRRIKVNTELDSLIQLMAGMHLHLFLVRTGTVNPPARLSVGRDDSRVQACGFSSPWPPGAAAVETDGDHVAPPQAQAQFLSGQYVSLPIILFSFSFF
jgi:hypothetical protein